MSAPVLEVRDLVRRFRRADGRWVIAVDSVSLSLERGETLGLVGESGCGKSSLARAIVQLPPPDAGAVLLDGEDLTQGSSQALRERRRRMQMVFQDPVSSLNPRRRVGEIVGEPLQVWGGASDAAQRDRVAAALTEVGFDAQTVWSRRPHEMSGGQCQRIAIARALMLEPEVLVLDEPVSALDVSVQAQILNLLIDIRARRSFSMLFISHDLAVIRNLCDRVAVMYLGRIVEIGRTEDIYRRPSHPYTRALLDSVLVPAATSGPAVRAPPSGVQARSRCCRRYRVARAVPAFIRWSR
jgi:peptide/nickel transport system ATP-binding protein